MAVPKIIVLLYYTDQFKPNSSDITNNLKKNIIEKASLVGVILHLPTNTQLFHNSNYIISLDSINELNLIGC